MRGDLYDLFTILRLTDIVLQYTDSHGQQLWTVAERKKILTVAYALMKAFRDAKTKHRVEHHMKTGITERRDVCDARRSETDRPITDGLWLSNRPAGKPYTLPSSRVGRVPSPAIFHGVLALHLW